ncbi:MAG: TolC family protein [Gammaproteobacteria bacterium]|nr:TolC family protein [Gammaproteobacteria bacterium]
MLKNQNAPERILRIASPNRLAFGVFLWVWAACAPVLAAPGLALDDYFKAALDRSEVIATQSELIRQAEERYQQAVGALLPTVSGTASYTWQEPLASDVPTTSTTLLSRQPLAKLTATQPLYRGFREFAALRQTQALVDAQHDDRLNARVLLFKDVAQNFYNVLSIEQDLRNFDEEIGQNLDREAELKTRVRIGRSRDSEILNVQTTIGTLRAQVEQLRGQLQVEREAFAFLSGLESSTPLNDTEAMPGGLNPLDDYLARIALRPDVQAGRKRQTAAQENVTSAKGAHLPSVDLNGNYYFDRPGALKDVAWDVQIALTVPLYSGGSLQSKTREAMSQHTQAELTVSQIGRQAEQEIRSLYQTVVFDRLQLDALEKSTEAAKKSYQAQRRDYRLGLVTNLEVLQALTAFQVNQRALDRARYNAKLDFIKLQAATMNRAGLRDTPTP